MTAHHGRRLCKKSERWGSETMRPYQIGSFSARCGAAYPGIALSPGARDSHKTVSHSLDVRRTALGAHKIGTILRAGIGLLVFPIYGCAAPEAQAVCPPLLLP